MRTAPLLLALATLLGCGNPLSPGDLSDWAAARARWESRPLRDYQFETQISCFCSPEVNQWTRVTVVGGTVVEAQGLEESAPYPASILSYWPTIDELFARVLSANGSDGVDRIRVSYDPVLGYPTHVDVNYDSNIQDAGATYRVRNLHLMAGSGGLAGASIAPPAGWPPG